jgi:cell division protein ZapB
MAGRTGSFTLLIRKNVSTMNDKTTENMDLSALEARVDELIRTVDNLKTENTALRSQQEHMVNERSSLIEKTEQARARIESMITRLRAMETRT